MDRILNALTSSETWTNIAAFVVGWALAELRAWVAGRMRVRRWRREARQTLPPRDPPVIGRPPPWDDCGRPLPPTSEEGA